MSGRLKIGYTIMVFINAAFLIRSTSSTALVSSYQKEKCVGDEFFIYTVR